MVQKNSPRVQWSIPYVILFLFCQMIGTYTHLNPINLWNRAINIFISLLINLLLLFVTIRNYSPLFATIRHYSPIFVPSFYYSPLFVTIRHYSRLFALFGHYSGFSIAGNWQGCNTIPSNIVVFLSPHPAIKVTCWELLVQSNLDYPDSLGLYEIVRIIEGPNNRECKY